MASDKEQRLQRGLLALDSGEFTSIRATARAYDLPEATLRHRYHGTTTTRRIAAQPLQLLTPAQEELTKVWILQCEDCKHPVTYPQLREFIGLISKQSGGPHTIGHHWIQRFLRRHPELQCKIGVKIDHLRADATTQAVLSPWFANLQRLISKHDILAADFYNVDETGIALGVSRNANVIGSSTTDRASIKSPEDREWVSIIETISALGRTLRPTVIFKGKSLQTSWFLNEKIPDWLYTASENGWSSNSIGVRWLEQVFIPETTSDPPRPRLLLLNGHGSHVTTKFMWKCYQNKIIVYYLIPHSSHVLQPLDLTCFSALKTRYRTELLKIANLDDSAPIKKIRFVQYYNLARQEGLKSQNAQAGWMASGIHPWNPDKVLQSKAVLRVTQASTLQDPTPSTVLIESNQRQLRTPQHSQDFRRQIRQYQGDSTVVRTLFEKTHKAYSQLEWEFARATSQLQAQTTQIEEHKAKRRKKKAIDCNEVFARIDVIQAAVSAVEVQKEAWERQDRAKEASRTAAAMIAGQMTSFLHEFHVIDLPVVEN